MTVTWEEAEEVFQELAVWYNPDKPEDFRASLREDSNDWSSTSDEGIRWSNF